MITLAALLLVTDASAACAAPGPKVARRPARVSPAAPGRASKGPAANVNPLTPVPRAMTAPAGADVGAAPAPESAPESAPAPQTFLTTTATTASPKPALPTSTDDDFLRLHAEAKRVSETSSQTRLAYVLAALALLAIALAAWRRKRASSTDTAEIQVMASRAFGPKHRLDVVRVDGKKLLVSLAPEGIRFLCALDDGAPSFERVMAESSPALTALETAEAAEAPSPEVEGIIRLKQARSKRGGAA